MKILSQAEPWGSPPGPVALAIGVFDGVHLGHAAVIRQTLLEARQHHGAALAVTFDRHPESVVAPDRAPPLILPLRHRLSALARLGLDATLVLTFDRAFSRQTAEDFVHRLAQGFRHVRSICVGSTFVFGHRRQGNLDLLRHLGVSLGFVTHGIPPVLHHREVVSSTRIRECIATGDFPAAAALLGRPYALAGKIGRGDQLGRTLGFPTANLEVQDLVLPPTGVYAGTAVLPSGRYPAAVNIGRRPTVDRSAAPLRVEAHLLGFQGDLYDQDLELILDHRLRDEKRFDSRDALVRQIAQDIEAVRSWAGIKALLGPPPHV